MSAATTTHPQDSEVSNTTKHLSLSAGKLGTGTRMTVKVGTQERGKKRGMEYKCQILCNAEHQDL